MAVPVTATAATMKSVPVELTTFGNVKAYSSVPIKAEVGGILTKVHFRKGQNVTAGALLFTIDQRPYKAALDQATANLERDKAQEQNAILNAERAKELVKKAFIAQSDYDKAQTDAKAISASVRGDEAAVVNAKLQLEHCSIHSPISGRASDILVDEGTLIKANDVTLVTINQMQPIEVSFSIPQSDLPAVRTYMAHNDLQVRAGLPKDNKPPDVGKLIFVNNTVDQGTGTVQLSAIFKNERELLWPGQYVNVTLVLTVQKDAIVVPSAAVQTGRDNKYIFVVKPDMTVEMRPVTVGRAAAAETVIETGIKAGEQVVVDGQLRIFPGAKAEIKTDVKPKSSAPGGRS